MRTVRARELCRALKDVGLRPTAFPDPPTQCGDPSPLVRTITPRWGAWRTSHEHHDSVAARGAVPPGSSPLLRVLRQVHCEGTQARGGQESHDSAKRDFGARWDGWVPTRARDLLQMRRASPRHTPSPKRLEAIPRLRNRRRNDRAADPLVEQWSCRSVPSLPRRSRATASRPTYTPSTRRWDICWSRLRGRPATSCGASETARVDDPRGTESGREG